ncbi:MAG TPA: D-alanine--D-alanine ligase [Sedimentisphaerales bacterium]|nr:D-alanine--D-alanine ligase [Sedimentisphaerales bacterium]
MTFESLTNPRPPIAGGQLKAAVLMGGIGEERDISIQSGACVTQALKDSGLNVIAADIAPDNLTILEDESIDVFFIALHGRFGEDGQLQQILEEKSLAYTGSGPRASRLAFDKLASKNCFAKAGITTPKAVKFDAAMGIRELQKQLVNLGERFVVKPSRQGSTIGVSIVDNPKSAVAAANECSRMFGDCMIEQFIAGREITVGILGNRALPVIEIKSKTGFYDYRAKYLDERTEFLFGTIDDPALTAEIEATALNCFDTLGCRHFARVDLIMDNEQTVYTLEVNTIPGFTTHSLLPMAAAKAGLSMSHLCMKIIEAALAEQNSAVGRQVV